MAPAPSTAETFNRPFRCLTIDSGQGPIRVQLCLSPLCSTIASIIEATAGVGWEGPKGGWRSLAASATVGLDLSALRFYTGYPAIPRFLLPRLHDPEPNFASQIEDIVRSTAFEIGRDLSATFGPEPPDEYRPFIDRPRQALEEVAQALDAYHKAAIAPRWPTMREVLQRDVFRLAYLLATRDTESSLNKVHPSISYRDGLIEVRGHDGNAPTPSLLGDRLLMLTPLVCDPSGVIADLGDAATVKIGYAAPGARAVWSSRPETVEQRNQLAELLGLRRAEILARLDAPATTTALSQDLRLAASTISEHLHHLMKLGLVARTRSGRQVYYQRTDTGSGLLDLFA